jgi:hypothetical protein
MLNKIKEAAKTVAAFIIVALLILAVLGTVF